MEACQQAPGMNMLEHGISVHESYKELIKALGENSIKCEELRALWSNFKDTLPPPDVLKQYHVFHDCGKHLCLTIDEEGKRRFPNHAAESTKQYSIVFPEDGFTAKLISKDMDFHMLKGDDLLKLCESPFAPILYFTAWAEINSNAAMFGGYESESYKIKRSRLIQAGKKLLKTIKG
jgi:hypothetical protein